MLGNKAVFNVFMTYVKILDICFCDELLFLKPFIIIIYNKI